MENRRDTKRITLADVAKELGVSKSTVSRAISGKGRIGKEMQKKIRSYIETCNYRPNVMARGLAESKTYNIALVMPEDFYITELPFFQNCMSGISQMASEMDYDVVLSMVTQKDISQLERIVNLCKIDGLILSQIQLHDVALEFLKKKNLPFLVIGSIEDETVIQVDHDHIEGCRELTQLLLQQGIRKMALLGGNENYLVTKNRYQGYQNAFERMNLCMPKEGIYFDMDKASNVESAVDILLEQKMECILCMDDHICMQVLTCLRKKKIEIPNTIKIASFYNSQLLQNNVPGITSLQFDARKLGITACKLLLERIQGKKIKQYTVLGYDIEVKESTQNNYLGKEM